MTKAEYIEEIHNFFKTDEYKLHWNGYATKKDAQKNGIEVPMCTVEFLKDGFVVRTVTCGTEIDCLREIYKEVYDAWYKEWHENMVKESEKQRAIADEERKKKFEEERIAEMESNIQISIQDRIFGNIFKNEGKSRTCFVAGYGILENGEKAIAVYQFSGTPEVDNKKWHIFKVRDIKHFRLMTEADIASEAPEGLDTTDIWNVFQTILCKVEFPKKKKLGFFSRLLGING
jgi:hypothetical protein